MYIVSEEEWKEIPGEFKGQDGDARTIRESYFTDLSSSVLPAGRVLAEHKDFEIADDDMILALQIVEEAASLDEAQREEWLRSCAEVFVKGEAAMKFVEMAADIAGSLAERRRVT